MSTTTGPDLSTARRAVEALMDDTCIIMRDVQGTGDDVFDPETGTLTPPNPDDSTVYNGATLGDGGRELGGKCKFSPMTRDPRTATEGGVEVRTGLYNFGIPWDAPEPQEGDVVTCTSSRRDPLLVGKEFTVRNVAYSTFLVSRKLTLEIRQ